MDNELAVVFLSAFAAVLLAAWATASLLGSTARRWRERFGADLGRGLQHSFLYLDTVRLFRLNLAVLAAAAGGVAWLTGEPLVALLALALLGSAPSLALAWLRRRRLSRLVIQLPEAAMLIAGALRSGGSLSQAIAQAARELPSPAGRELDLVMREQRLGVSMDQAMAHLERRAPIEEVTLFAAAVRISQETGGNLAETLERLAESLRRKSAIEGKIDALTAQGRLQGWVMALLPLAVGAVLFAIEPDAMQPLFATWQGWVVCAVIVVMEALGLYFIRRIVNIDV
jgi:tight adherence protein B